MGVNQWLVNRNTHMLNRAYEVAQAIKTLETQYADGQPITESDQMGKTVYDYARSLCDRHLLQIRNQLTQFRINSFLLGAPLPTASLPVDHSETNDDNYSSSTASVDVVTKLSFIESVISQYREKPYPDTPIDPQQLSAKPQNKANPKPISAGTVAEKLKSSPPPNAATKSRDLASNPAISEVEMAATELARPGLLGSFSMNKQKTAQYEQQVVQELRQWRQQSKRALRWLAILLFVPLISAILTKQLLFGPLLGSYSDKHPTDVQLNEEIRTEFSAHLAEFKSELEIRELLKLTPPLNVEARQDMLAEKATELWREARDEELNGLKNVLADGTATLAFAILVFFNQRRLTVIRTFANRAFLSLSDPVKIFVFILVTDIFVGFHSAEGWDAILTGLTYHFGLPDRPNAIKIFIATVPVMMDSFIKFWIFSYLTRFSPTSSAIFERMNT